MMKKIILILTLGVHLISLAQSQSKQKVSELTTAAVKDKKVVGISSGVINVEGETAYFNAGFSNREVKTKFDELTISRIASISKIFTAVAIMQLIEKGKISLDTKVGSLIPEFSVGNKAKITIKHLLEHSSGIPHYRGKKEINNTKEYEKLSDVLLIYKDRDLLFDPGIKFEYSVYGYVTLGIVIEKVSGLSYENYLSKNIFNKAGMNNSSIEEFGETSPNKAKLYHKHSKRKIIEIIDQNLSNRIPAGGIQTTVEDLLLFGKALVCNQLISKDSFRLMMVDNGLVEKPNNPYGFGLRIYSTADRGGLIVGHNGQQLGSSAFLFLFPDEKVATAVISNTSVFNTGAIGIALYDVSKELN